MKKLNILFAAAALAISGTASAQFSNTGTNSTTGTTTLESSVESNGYNLFSIDYVNQATHPDYGDGRSTNGVGLAWTKGISISKSLPLYFETGLAAQLGFWSDSASQSGYEVSQKLTTFNIAVPLNITYKYYATPSFAIQPYLGLNLKVNIVASGKNEVTAGGKTNENSYSCFSKDDMGSSDATWKRFQLGWHIGARFCFNTFNLHVSYGTDFIELSKKVGSSTLEAGIGFQF